MFRKLLFYLSLSIAIPAVANAATPVCALPILTILNGSYAKAPDLQVKVLTGEAAKIAIDYYNNDVPPKGNVKGDSFYILRSDMLQSAKFEIVLNGCIEDYADTNPAGIKLILDYVKKKEGKSV